MTEMQEDIEELIELELDRRFNEGEVDPDCPMQKPVDELEPDEHISAKDIAILKDRFLNLGLLVKERGAFFPRELKDNNQKIELVFRKVFRRLNNWVPDPRKYLVARSSIKITTGSKALDGILGGGIESGSITELFGEYGSGKTQLCHNLAVTCQLPLNEGGEKGGCMYIDTEGTYQMKRIINIGKLHNLTPAEVQANVIVRKCLTNEFHTKLLHEIAANMSKRLYTLIIIDSASNLYKTGFSPLSEEEDADRQKSLARFLQSVKQLAFYFKVAVIVTNLTIAQDTEVDDALKRYSMRPVGGSAVANASSTRLHLEKIKRGENTICKISKSSRWNETECLIAITAKGISDVTITIDD